MRKSVEEAKRAAALRAKAASVGAGGVSSDDPDAAAKLGETLDERKALQAFMIAANRVVRAALKAGATHESGDEALRPWRDRLEATTGAVVHVSGLRASLTPDCMGRTGFAPYQLANNRAEIARLERRLRDLARADARRTTERDIGPCRYIANAEENRLQFVFDAKPDAETRAILKSHGFRWAPSQGAWQRKWTNGTVHAAERVIKALE